MKFEMRPRQMAKGLVGAGLVALACALWIPLRAASLQVRCQSNLRQIGLATMQYTRDYDEKWMLARNWKTSLAPYGKSNDTTNVDRRNVCPKTAIGFAYNIHFDGNRLQAVSNPATIALFYEPAKTVNADEGQSWATGGIHGDGSNVGFADGHVARLHLKPVFWSQQLQRETETLARSAAINQANDLHQYRASLQ